MSMKITNGVDLVWTGLIRALMHPVTATPAGALPGAIWFRSDTDQMFMMTSGGEVAFAAGAGIASLVEDTTPQLGGNLDTNTFTIAGRDIAADGALLDTALQPGFILDDDNFTADSATQPPSQQSVAAYVAAQIAGGTLYRGGYNATGNVPDLVAPAAGTVLKGHQYTVDTAGTFFTQAVQAGDLLIAEVDDPAVEANWTIVQRNLDAATDTVAGTVRLATAADVAALDPNAAVTPLRLSASGFTRKAGGLIGDGAATVFVLNHGLGTKDVVWSIREVATDEFILADVDASAANDLTIEFATPPANAAYHVTVVG